MEAVSSDLERERNLRCSGSFRRWRCPITGNGRVGLGGRFSLRRRVTNKSFKERKRKERDIIKRRQVISSMTEDLSPDPPPLPPLPPDPVSPGPDVGVRGSSSVSPSSSPMDLFPEVSVSDSTVPIKNPSRLPQASSGRSLPLQGSFIFGSLSPNAPILPVPSVDSTNENPDSSIPAVYPSEIPIQVSHPAGSVSDGAPNIAGQAPNNHSPSSAAFNWASNLSSASKFPPPSASVSMSAEGKPRVKVPNAVFERGAKIHADYIVGIFYGKAPSYGKIWAVLNYL
ncbi:hypothetical protein Bca4012_059730 [Brassica carinata]